MNINSISALSNFNPVEKNIELTVKNNSDKNKFQQLLQKSLNKPENNLSTVGKNRPEEKKLMDVCIEMESIFVSRMLREMRNTVPEEKLIDGGFAEQVFEDMLYDEYALTLSKQSNLGLAKMLYDELSRI